MGGWAKAREAGQFFEGGGYSLLVQPLESGTKKQGPGDSMPKHR